MINVCRRYCISVKISKAFVFLLFAFIAGCAGVTIKDDLPPSSPKGYADFANYSFGYEIIYSMQDGKKVKEGSLTYTGEILRLARTPGNYDFLIEHRDDSGRENAKLVNVKIVRDMLTFITVDRKIVNVESVLSGRSEAKLITYNVKISVAETPVPVNFGSEANETEILNNLLNDSDRRARLYAIGFLQKTRGSRDENLLKRIKTLATDDPNWSVREKATALLKKLGIDAFRNLLLLENFEANRRKWFNSRRGYDFFYNDELLLSAGADGCETEIMRSPLDLPQDFDVELASTWKSGISGDAYGVFIGSDENNFNHFGISGHGQAVVRPLRNNEVSTDLIAWTDVPAIKKQGAAPNHLRVEVRGNIWKYYVNDAYIGTITNTMKMNKAIIGLRVCRAQTIAVEQLKISRVLEN
jgi:hypothetical protein